jgi:hypothetical protein
MRQADEPTYEHGLTSLFCSRREPGTVTERLDFTTEVIRTNTGLHTNRARRHVGKSRFDLAARPLLTQYDRAAIVLRVGSV